MTRPETRAASVPAPVRAAGTVLWRPTGEIAVVHRPKLADWSLPKGKLEPGETPAATAVRETWEETGSRAVLGRPLGTVNYPVRAGHKVVTYFAARVRDESPFRPNHEVDQLRWLPPTDAAELLTYDSDRSVLARFTELPADLTTVLLVRHGKAGHRSRWSGPDAERPLSPAGREQAAALRVMLPLFGPTRVFAADRVRCVETVRGLADDLGVPVRLEPALSEDAFRADPLSAVDRLLAIVAAGGVPVICSQGGAIPGLIRGSGLALADVPCKKGSTWVLSFAGTRLRAADYLASALPTPCP